MMTIWGRLERIATDLPDDRWVQIRTVVPGTVAIRTYILVGEKTLIARGTEQVALSNLREGEFVEATFRSARTGLVKADAIYVQPESMINESKVPSSASPQTNPQGSMQQAPADPKSVCCCSDQPSMSTGSGALDNLFLTLMRQPLWPEAGENVETNARLRE